MKRLIYPAVLTLMIASTTGALLPSCSTASQSHQAPNTTPKTETEAMQGMEHGSEQGHPMSMDLGPADADYDLRFIDAMSIHHQGAVEMAQDALNKAKHPEIKQLAQDIITAQNREIRQLKQWRQQWYPQASSKPMAYHAQMGHTMEMPSQQAKSMMMSGNLGPADAEYDLRFMKAMIPHHEGAVTMAQDALNKSQHPEIKQLAQ
ncbi:MAG TPA: DUF305 domain-containing protein, partial [Candidatus Caenarcaniphilales bacterium]